MPHGDMTDAEPTIIRGEVCRFDFSGPNTCPISKVLESEIRLNGILVGVLGESDHNDCLSAVGDEDCVFYILLRL